MAKLQVGTEDGASIDRHYDDVGSGAPVVRIHGWPLSGRSREAQVPRPGRGRVPRGHRRSPRLRLVVAAVGYDYDTLTADLASFNAALLDFLRGSEG